MNGQTSWESIKHSEDEQKLYGFGLTWGEVKDERWIFTDQIKARHYMNSRITNLLFSHANAEADIRSL